jgi:methionyl-tRNA formyltransferase
MINSKKLNVVFFGTPDFSVPSLDMLFNHPNINLSYVVSMPDRPAGRGQNLKSPEVIDFAKSKKIDFFQCDNINKEVAFLDKLESERVDLIIVLAFAQFLGKRVLELPQIGCFNIHTSLLPKYRGAAPIQYALLNGDSSTGVSIQRMVKKMDAGDLVISHPISIQENETGGQLYTKLKYQAALSLNDLITNYLNGKITYTPQDESAVSFAPTLKKTDGFLNFKEETFFEIKNKIRALDPWPGTYCFLDKKRLKVFSIEKSIESLAPGEIKISKDCLTIGCKDGSLNLVSVQLEGKKRSMMKSLINGLKESTTINPEG